MRDKPFAITLDVGSSLANHTGSWRVQRPVYVSRRPPCATACPALQDPQTWLYLAEEADYERAWRQIMEWNPFPAVIGRVCYHPCQTSCNRAQLDESVGINAVERFLGDEALRRGWTVPVTAPPSGKRVLVVGAGPAGLSAAYHLTRLGHAVTVRDAGTEPGGMMRYGIPSYRLPRDVLDAEIARIVALGVTVELGRTVTDLPAALAEDGFDAAFVAVGAQLGKRTEIPAGDCARVLDAIRVLHDVAEGEPPRLGRQVVVYGGGNTAMDAARTAKRIGATDAVVVYRRTRERMPAHEVDLAQALAEGVTVRWLSTIANFDSGRVLVEKMSLDGTGFPQPTGEFEELPADSVVLAVGQEADLGLLDAVPGVQVSDGVVGVDADLATGHPGVFAGGDIVRAERTVTNAIGQGARAARGIDAYLRGSTGATATGNGSTGATATGNGSAGATATGNGSAGATATGNGSAPVTAGPATFDLLNTWYYADAPATVQPQLAAARRTSTFDEVVGGLDESTALFEARRCMSCGNCFECDNCYGVCPDNAVIKLGPGLKFAIDYEYCKGCGLCVAECPCGAIEMRPEST
jgi:2-oxoacid:acceptor oxidoreductase delta subunit (pyruvate/2-ketoisovalerate family)